MIDSIGQRIKLARESAGLKQSDLADRAGTQWQQVSRWERDQATPRAKAVRALCDALGVSPQWLLSGEGPMYSSPLEAYARGVPELPSRAAEDAPYQAPRSLDVALLEQVLRAALETAPNELPERLAQAIADAYHTALRTRRLDKVGELVRTFLS